MVGSWVSRSIAGARCSVTGSGVECHPTGGPCGGAALQVGNGRWGIVHVINPRIINNCWDHVLNRSIPLNDDDAEQTRTGAPVRQLAIAILPPSLSPSFPEMSSPTPGPTADLTDIPTLLQYIANPSSSSLDPAALRDAVGLAPRTPDGELDTAAIKKHALRRIEDEFLAPVTRFEADELWMWQA